MALQIREKLESKKALAYGIGGIATLAILWCLATYSGHVKPLFLPSPTGVWEGFQFFMQKNWLAPAIGESAMRVFKALVITVLVGVPVGAIMGAFSQADSFLGNIVNAGKAVPPTGLIGLIVMWFGIDEKAKMVFLVLGSLFYMITLTKDAVANVKDEYVSTAKDIGANAWQVLTKVLFPGALPQIWDGIIVCHGIMWTYIVLAEYLNASQDQIGLGFLLQIGSRTQESGEVYCALILIALVCTISDVIMKTIKKQFFNW